MTPSTDPDERIYRIRLLPQLLKPFGFHLAVNTLPFPMPRACVGTSETLLPLLDMAPSI
jgi:hypothetical protein